MPMVRRRRPLLRAAAVGGIAYSASKKGAQAAQAQAEPAQPQYAPPAPEQASAGMSPADIDRLKELAQLHEQGILTDAEFEEQKRVILSGS